MLHIKFSGGRQFSALKPASSPSTKQLMASVKGNFHKKKRPKTSLQPDTFSDKKTNFRAANKPNFRTAKRVCRLSKRVCGRTNKTNFRTTNRVCGRTKNRFSDNKTKFANGHKRTFERRKRVCRRTNKWTFGQQKWIYG